MALVGEAVHVIPPIGAQGLNLGLRDAACIADCVADAIAAGGDVGAPGVLEAYGRMRRTDITSRIWAVDLLNRSLLSQRAAGAGVARARAAHPEERRPAAPPCHPRGPWSLVHRAAAHAAYGPG